VGVILGYPGERADPLEREETSDIDVSSMAEDVTKLPTSSSDSASLRQPPTVSDTTAVAFPRSTIFTLVFLCFLRRCRLSVNKDLSKNYA